jgi:hypothetical protein
MAAMEMEEQMYSPKLSEETVHKLWKLKQLCKRPMTQLAEELIQRGLEGFVREAEQHFAVVGDQREPVESSHNVNGKERGNAQVGR